jgi:hypothetical protein
MMVRVSAYLLAAAGLSAVQFGFFDCSGLPAFSFGLGMACVMALCLTAEGVYRLARSPDRSAFRIAAIAGNALAGGAAAFVLGAATLFSHLCG